MTVKRPRRHVRSRGTTTGGVVPARHALDHYLPHPDTVIRHRVMLPAGPEQTYEWVRRFDWAQLCEPVGRAIAEMRAVPPFVAEVARRARRVPPTARFIVGDALRRGFIPLSEKAGRHLVLGAVGKLWKHSPELIKMDPEEFAAFRDPKYVKILVAFLVVPYGEDRSILKLESRLLATDDSARAHLRRAWRTAEPYIDFYLRRALKTLAGVAKEYRAATPAG
ncbi:MAG: hypothetical protein HY700_13450 [Gemmatimonadetes bacterium]|nr:hypothetical protein [Gemmatimonadota bacterium]